MKLPALLELVEVEQGSDEWFLARLGRATTSEFSSILAKGEGKTRKAYMLKLAAERLTGKPTESFSNKHTERGTEQEPFARMAYEALTGNMVQEVGFVSHRTLMMGCSPDGFIDDDGGLEIKSAIPTVQIERFQKGGLPSEYRAQVLGTLWLTGREFWDFASFSPDMPEHLQLYVYRASPDREFFAVLDAEVPRFLKELDQLVEDLRRFK